jgi:hypothetical protein
MTLGGTFALASLFASGLPNAASLESARRDALVRRGEFSAIRGSVKLDRGNKIRTGSAGVARLVYPDGRGVGAAVNSVGAAATRSRCSFDARVGAPGQGDPRIDPRRRQSA